jgi:hypothetical protein
MGVLISANVHLGAQIMAARVDFSEAFQFR